MNPTSLSSEQKEQVKAIARSIIALGEAEGWRHFVRAAEAQIQAQTPTVLAVSSTDQAIAIASKMAFVSGIRHCLGIVTQQQEILNSFNDSERASAE